MADPQPPTELLDRILERTHADSFELPPLVIQTDAGPSWFEKLLKWIASFFPQAKESSDVNWLGFVLWSIAIVGAVMVVVALVSVIVNQARRAARKAKDAAYGLRPASGGGGREGLNSRLEIALKAGRLDEAARLRWKLHLARRGLSASVTPGETEGFGKYYPLMFGLSAAAQSEYADLDGRLGAIEGRP